MRVFYLRVLSDFLTPHSFIVTFFTPRSSSPFYSTTNKQQLVVWRVLVLTFNVGNGVPIIWDDMEKLDMRSKQKTYILVVEVYECDGWVWERDTMGVSSIFKVICSSSVSVIKHWYRSVSGLTGTGSIRWSGSPVPTLTGEVVHRVEPTGSPVWTGYPGRNEFPGSHCSRNSVRNSSETLTRKRYWSEAFINYQ